MTATTVRTHPASGVCQCARTLEVVDPMASLYDVHRPPVVMPSIITMDGHRLPAGCRVVDVDYDPDWPLTVTLAVPSSLVKYVVTRTLADGTPLGGRVWIGGVEVHTPNDPISYPEGGDVAHVDMHVDEFRIGADRNLERV